MVHKFWMQHKKQYWGKVVDFIFKANCDIKLKTKVCIYLVHSSLLHHTEQACHPKPGRKKENEKPRLRDFEGFWPEPVREQKLICGNQPSSLPGHSPLILSPRVQCWVTWINLLPSCKSLSTSNYGSPLRAVAWCSRCWAGFITF